MFRKKNGQEFMDERNVDSSVNDKEEKKGFFHRRKKKEINLYEDDMGYIEEDGDFSEEEYDKELDELQEDEKPEKRKRRFWHRKKEDTSEEAQTEDLAEEHHDEDGFLSDEDAIILQEPEKKMSKSDANENAVVRMLDTPDAILRKFKRAVTDSDGVVRFDRETKPGVSNLMCIYSTFTGKSNDEIAAEFEGKGYGDFKLAVAEVTADALAPVQAEYARILADKTYVDEVLKSGAERASRLANRTVSKVYRKVGLLQLDK